MLLPFPVAARRLALHDPAGLERALGLRLAPDWPSANFARVIQLIADQTETDDWVFLVQEAGQVVGEIGAKAPPDTKLSVEIGYGIAPSAQRRGLGVASCAAFLRIAEARGLRSVRADCLVDNLGSIRILERNHFVRTGESVDEDGPLVCWERPLGLPG